MTRAKKTNILHGQSLIEVLIALAILLTFVSGTLILAYRYTNTLIKSNDFNDVHFVAQESIDAVQSMSYNNWATLTDGAHGLSSAGGQWNFSGSSDVVANKYTREVSVASVNRDGECKIVSVGGDPDADTKYVTVTLRWTPVSGVQQQFTTSKYFTNWQTPINTCGVGDADCFEIDVVNAVIGENHKSLLNIDIENTCARDIVLDKMMLTWDIPGARITEIKIEDTNHWHKTGPGTPIGAQPSGTELDMVDYTLEADDDDAEIDRFRFDAFMDGANMSLTVTTDDDTTKTVSFSPPSE